MLLNTNSTFESYGKSDKNLSDLLNQRYRIKLSTVNTKDEGIKYHAIANRASLINFHGHFLLDETEVIYVDNEVEGLLVVLDIASNFAESVLKSPSNFIQVLEFDFIHNYTEWHMIIESVDL